MPKTAAQYPHCINLLRAGFEMGLIRLIARVLKFGGPKVDLVTGNPEHYPAEWIRGEVSITAPNYRQSIKSVTISLKEFWVEYLSARLGYGADRYRRRGSVTIADDFVFLPGMKYHFPFEIQLPANCRFSSEKSGWRLGVEIAAPGRSVMRRDFNIHVGLSKVLHKVVAAIENDSKFLEVPRGRKFLVETSATRFVFRPPDYLQSELYFFMLDVSIADEGGIKGIMRFKATDDDSLLPFTADSEECFSYEFQIEPSRWFDDKGQIQYSAITNIVSERLREVLNGRIRHGR